MAKNCTKGYSCKASCINKSYECTVPLDEASSSALTRFLDRLRKLVGLKTSTEKAEEARQAEEKRAEAARKSEEGRLEYLRSEELHEQIPEYEDDPKAFADLLGVDQEEAFRISESVAQFTTGPGDGTSSDPNYVTIRKAQNEGDIDSPAGQAAQDIERYLERMPKMENALVHRGMGFQTEDELNSFFEALDAGGIDFGAATSFSTRRGVAQDYLGQLKSDNPGGRVLMSVRTQSGVSLRNNSTLPEEHEVLTPASTRYNQISRRQNNRGDWIIELEEIV